MKKRIISILIAFIMVLTLMPGVAFATEPVDALCFTAIQSGSIVTLNDRSNIAEVTVQTSTDGSVWSDYTFGTPILLQNVGDKVYFRNQSNLDAGFSIGWEDYYQFILSGHIVASGGGNSKPINPVVASGDENSKPINPVEKPTTYDEPEKAELDQILEFPDIDATEWYCDSIHYCLSNGLMNGLPGNVFEPSQTCSRAMMWTILGRMEGVESTIGPKWYENGQSWAKTNGISDGKNPEGNITREEFATMLYRYVKAKGYDVAKDTENVNTLSYNDIFDVSTWASEGVHWCLANGIITGKTIKGVEGYVDPQGLLIRAEAAAMMQRLCEKQ